MKSVGDLCGMVKVFVQGVNVLENAAAPTNDEVVGRDHVLGVFWKGYTANVLKSQAAHQLTCMFRPSLLKVHAGKK